MQKEIEQLKAQTNLLPTKGSGEKREFPKQLKKSIVQTYLNSHQPLDKFAASVGISSSALRRWTGRHNNSSNLKKDSLFLPLVTSTPDGSKNIKSPSSNNNIVMLLLPINLGHEAIAALVKSLQRGDTLC